MSSIDLSMFERFAVNFQPGDIIFCEYEPGDNFYLIQSGRVQIVKILGNIEKNIDILVPAGIFVEMAIREEAPRSATGVASQRGSAAQAASRALPACSRVVHWMVPTC